jgi:signal transduction histidine kinase
MNARLWITRLEYACTDPRRAHLSVIDDRFSDVLPDETADRFRGVIDDVLETGDQQRIEYSLDVQSGRHWYESRVVPLRTDGETRTVFWIARDITERKRREQRPEVFNRILRHSLRNQLDVIRTHVETLAAGPGAGGVAPSASSLQWTTSPGWVPERGR